MVYQGRGAATGYDYAVALPASGDSEELAKENTKSAAALKGELASGPRTMYSCGVWVVPQWVWLWGTFAAAALKRDVQEWLPTVMPVPAGIRLQ